MTTVLFLILLLKFPDGHYDADAYVVPSGLQEDCINGGEGKKAEIIMYNPWLTVVFMCRTEINPLADVAGEPLPAPSVQPHIPGKNEAHNHLRATRQRLEMLF